MTDKAKPETRSPIRSLVLLLALTGCACTEPPVSPAFTNSGNLEDARIREASGLARSQREPDVLWIINDNGAKELVHAVDRSGARLGEFDLQNSKNKDWEDLASFRLNGVPYLMIADIGDNEARRDHRTLYFVEEPRPARHGEAPLTWRLDFRYPGGPRDAESAAVDIDKQRALILSKRDIPPVLYAVPLRGESTDIQNAVRLGPVNSLVSPTQRDRDLAPIRKDWFWQPVGMDISQDNRAAVILTYRAIYYFERSADQDWLEALNTKPYRISLGNFREAEAVAFGDSDRTIVVTGETRHSVVLSVDLSGVAK